MRPSDGAVGKGRKNRRKNPAAECSGAGLSARLATGRTGKPAR
nr:MAG TPA: hypothetical protein [Caudoviricetes sp.]